MDFITERDGSFRVLSFQSKEILDKLMGTGYYRADNSLSREKRLQ